MQMNRLYKVLFFALLIKPLVLFWLGLNVFFRQRLPLKGPAVIVANHNSHLDTLVLMSLYPLRMIYQVRPVAAADYFLKNKFMAWFSLNVIGILPIERRVKAGQSSLFASCHQALEKGQILIIFPEGSRGEPEQLSQLKRGVHHLMKEHEHIKLIPIMMHGLGRSLPKGEAVLVPFNCDVVIGQAIAYQEDCEQYIEGISTELNSLNELCLTRQKIVED